MKNIFGANRWLVFLALAGIAIPAAVPLFSSGKYYFSDDGFLHLFRVFALDRELRQGIFYPRWLPEFGFGYGFPVFNFYAPLVFYFAETFHVVGLPIADAIKAQAAATIAVATVGAYLLGLQLFRASHSPRLSGVLTAAAFVYFPYFFVDIYTRGAFAEALALAILPWFLWSFLRLLARQTVGSAVLCALFVAALMFSHNMVVYLSMPLVGALLVWELLCIPSSLRLVVLLRAGGAILLGLALSAIFWLPSLAELRFVWLSRDIQQGTALYMTDFLSLQNLIQPLLPYDYVVHPFPLSLLPAALGLVSLLAALAFCRDRILRGRLLILGIMVFIYTILLLDLTLPFWLGVPLLNGIQFPWRLSTFVGLGLALLIGALASIVLPRLFSAARTERVADILTWATVIVFAGILMWNAIGRLFVQRSYGPSGEPTLGQVARNEMNMGRLGLSSQREYLPVTVDSLSDRVNPTRNAKESPVIEIRKYDSVERSFTVLGQDPISISLRSFYFPGWQAYLDGQPVPTYPATSLGLLTTDVQSGEHRVDFKWQDTVVRQIAAFISGLGAIFLLAFVVRASRRYDEELPAIGSFLGVGLAIFLLPSSLAFAAHPNVLQPKQLDVSPELRLIGWGVEDAQLGTSVWRVSDARQRLDLHIIWQVKQSVQEKPFTWRFVGQSGRMWVEPEQMARYGSGFVSAWQPNEIVEDYYSLPLDATMPPGRFDVQLSYVDNDFVSVGMVELERTILPKAIEPSISHRMDAKVGNSIRFLGYNAVDSAHPGESIPITLFWQSERPLFEDYTVFAQVLNSDGERVAQWDSLTDGIYPMTLWTPGVTVPDRREIFMPRDLQPGLYRLIAGMYRNPDNPERLPVTTAEGPSADDVIQLGTLKVPMNAQNVTPQHGLGISLGATIELNGFDLQTSRDEVALKLYWQASVPVGKDYKVFVHLVDDAGNIVAQRDQMPLRGRYPTRIWDAGERVVDPYMIPIGNLRAGRYRFLVGMYNPDSGERLSARDSGGNELVNRQIDVASIEVGTR